RVTQRFGLLIARTCLITGSLFRYLRPNHRRRDDTFSVVTGSAGSPDAISSSVGGLGPPRVTDDMKPVRWRAMASFRLYLRLGTDVIPSRALVAFWRCEHMFAIWCWGIFAARAEAGTGGRLGGRPAIRRRIRRGRLGLEMLILLMGRRNAARSGHLQLIV